MRPLAALFLHFSSRDSAKAFFFKRMEERCMLGNDEEQGHLEDRRCKKIKYTSFGPSSPASIGTAHGFPVNNQFIYCRVFLFYCGLSCCTFMFCRTLSDGVLFLSFIVCV